MMQRDEEAIGAEEDVWDAACKKVAIVPAGRNVGALRKRHGWRSVVGEEVVMVEDDGERAKVGNQGFKAAHSYSHSHSHFPHS